MTRERVHACQEPQHPASLPPPSLPSARVSLIVTRDTRVTCCVGPERGRGGGEAWKVRSEARPKQSGISSRVPVVPSAYSRHCEQSGKQSGRKHSFHIGPGVINNNRKHATGPCRAHYRMCSLTMECESVSALSRIKKGRRSGIRGHDADRSVELCSFCINTILLCQRT